MIGQQKIAVIYSLPSTNAQNRRFVVTDEDTKESAEEIHSSLTRLGFNVSIYPVKISEIESIKHIHADAFFNVLEWDGNDLPSLVKATELLAQIGKPFTGSDAKTINITADKVLSKKALVRYGLPTANCQVFETGTEIINQDLVFPVIIKPSLEHCSIGLGPESVVQTPEILKRVIQEKVREFVQPFVVEEFIAGREFQVSVYEKNGNPIVLPLAEVVFQKNDPNEFLTFESRWDDSHADYQKSKIVLLQGDKELSDKVSLIAQKTFNTFQFHDYARLDIRVRENDIFILEANANPGLGDDDDYGMTVSYKAGGMSFDDFILGIVISSFRRFGREI